MGWVEVAFGIILLLVVLVDTFETIILPRTVNRPKRLVTFLIDTSWKICSSLAKAVKKDQKRETVLSAFGPMVLVFLIIVWAGMLILGFALILWGLRIPIATPESAPSFPSYLYMSGTTLFTLGFGDITAKSGVGRTVSVIEAGVGFGFLAIVISYLPVLYQSFSRRESTILLLDARAGSPPVACELLSRHSEDLTELKNLLAEFERWCAGLLESYLSYPLLAYYRSQHERQTWLGATTAILDACSIIGLGFADHKPEHRALHAQAKLTYAIARHLVVDLAYILNAPPMDCPYERLTEEDWHRAVEHLKSNGWNLNIDDSTYDLLTKKRAKYETYLMGVSKHLMLPVPPWVVADGEVDNWQTTAWDGQKHF